MKDLIKVLWIDDNFNKQSRFISYAERIGLKLEGARSVEAVDKLKNNHWEYNAVLLDVNILPTEDSLESPSAKYGNKAIKKIEGIEEKKFPIVIYSGVEKTLKGEDGFQTYNEKYKVFDKNEEGKFKECLAFLKKQAESQPEFEIKTKHKSFFNIPDSILPLECKKQVLEILLEEDTEWKSYLTSLRKVLDAGFFPALKNRKLIPDEIDGLSSGSRFLSGQIISNFELTDPLPEKIKYILRFLIKDFENPGSHTFEHSENNKYLIKGLCFLTIDLCIWLEAYVTSAKKQNWKKYSNQGTIKEMKKHYGFIENNDFKQGIIFYYNQLTKLDSEKLVIGQKINFSVRKIIKKDPGQETQFIAFDLRQ